MMAHRIDEIVRRRTALERRIGRERRQLGEALDMLAPFASVANRAALAAQYVHERPLLGVLIGSVTGILLRRRLIRWLPIATVAPLAARMVRALLRR